MEPSKDDEMPSLVPISAVPSVKEMIALLEPPTSVVDVVTHLLADPPSVAAVLEKVPEPVAVLEKLSTPLVAALSAHQADLIKLVTDLVSKKPGTKEEALELFHKLQMHLGMWVVSELPGAEGKALLAGLWAMEELQKFNWKSCFGLK
jgi:hypothetical protein